MSDQQGIPEDEINLIELFKVVWSGKLLIAKVSGLFMIFGLVIAFTTPKEYSTSCTLIPEAINSKDRLGGSLGGLASLAGVDLGGMSAGSNTINPGLYQSVAESTPFLLNLLKQRYYFADEKLELTLSDYYNEHYKTSLLSKILGVPGMILGLLRNSETEVEIRDVETQGDSEKSNIVTLTLREQGILNDLKNRILVELDRELSLVMISVEMQDRLVAAQVAEFTQKYITEYVTTYSISKSKEQLKYIEKEYLERKKEFEDAQLNLALFRDRNRNMSTAQARSEEERLQSIYSLAFSVFNQLAQQRETIKLQVNKNTPVFSILEPVIVPLVKSQPKRMLIVLTFIVFGILTSIVILTFKAVYRK